MLNSGLANAKHFKDLSAMVILSSQFDGSSIHDIEVTIVVPQEFLSARILLENSPRQSHRTDHDELKAAEVY